MRRVPVPIRRGRLFDSVSRKKVQLSRHIR